MEKYILTPFEKYRIQSNFLIINMDHNKYKEQPKNNLSYATKKVNSNKCV